MKPSQILNRLAAVALLLVGSTALSLAQPLAGSPVRAALPVSKAALVFAIGGLGDGSFNDQTWAGLQRAGTDFGIDVSYHEPGDPAYRDAVLTQVANGDAHMVIATGTMFSDIITSLAASHTTQTFVCLDYASAGPMPTNLAGLSFREQEGAFLAGMVAALKSQSGTIGFVGAMPIPLIQRYHAGYAQGARYAVPGIRVEARYADTTDAGFDNPVRGRELANALIDAGADVIFHASGSTGLGVFEAAEARGVMAIGVDKDQSSQAAAGVIITSVLKKADVLVYDLIEETTSAAFPGGLHNYGLKEGTLDYVYNPALLSDAIRDQVEAAKAKIINGEISVNTTPTTTTAASNWLLFR